MIFGRRVKRTRSGTYQLRLPPEERRVLATLPAQLRELLDDAEGDDAVARLFPPAYPDNPFRDAEYQVFKHDELVERRKAALTVVEETLDADELSEDQLSAWMACINDIRLVLGTRLDVTEEMEDVAEDDPRAPLFALYGYLGWLLEQVVDALTGALPPPTQD